MNRILQITQGLNKRFPDGITPFQIITRLIAIYYHIEAELAASIENSYQKMKQEGLISE